MMLRLGCGGFRCQYNAETEGGMMDVGGGVGGGG